MAIKLKLKAEQIANYQFQNAPRGYNALEVDKFLDIVIGDYLKIEENLLVAKKELDELNAKIQQLEQEKDALVLENKKLKDKVPTIKGDVTQDNIKILKRIDALEKYLWKRGIDPTKIK